MLLINGAARNLRWFIEDVWGQFGDDHERPGAPLFPSERKNRDGSCARATDDVFRRSSRHTSVPRVAEALAGIVLDQAVGGDGRVSHARAGSAVARRGAARCCRIGSSH